jgi:hypothetical protein
MAFVGMKDPELCDMDDDPGIVEPDKLRYGRLLSLGKSNNNHKGGNGWFDEGNCIVEEKGAYMDYSQVEVDKMGEIGVDKEDAKNGTIDVEVLKWLRKYDDGGEEPV